MVLDRIDEIESQVRQGFAELLAKKEYHYDDYDNSELVRNSC